MSIIVISLINKGFAALGGVPCQGNARAGCKQAYEPNSQRKIDVTSKLPVGNMQVITLIRQTTDLIIVKRPRSHFCISIFCTPRHQHWNSPTAPSVLQFLILCSRRRHSNTILGQTRTTTAPGLHAGSSICRTRRHDSLIRCHLTPVTTRFSAHEHLMDTYAILCDIQ